MDLGRLIAAAALIAGCRGAEAAPTSDLRAALGVPASWVELPRVVAAAKAAMKGDATAQAWGDPASGCYFVQVTAIRANEDLAEVRAALAIVDGEPHVPGLTGKSRTWASASGDDVTARAAACVYNQREPALCAAACDAIWAKLPAAVTP
jgi:hypothetical protein